MNGLIDYLCVVHESGYEHIPFDEIEKLGIEATSESIWEHKLYIRPIDSKSSKRIFNLTEYPGAYYEFILPFIEARDGKPRRFNDCYFKFAKFGCD